MIKRKQSAKNQYSPSSSLGQVYRTIKTISKSLRHPRADWMLINRSSLSQAQEEEQLKKLFLHQGVDCVFDIGANNGQYASKLRSRVDYHGKIFSFEPHPDAHKACLAAAGHDKDWHVEKIAISDKNGVLKFNLMEDTQFSSFSNPIATEVDLGYLGNKATNQIEVKSETLYSCFNRLKEEYGFKRPFLKMDTQGYDSIVFLSGSEIIENFCGLQSELSIKRIYSSSIDFRDSIALYQNHGFELSALVPNNAGHFPDLIELDCIMYRYLEMPRE